jgi:hypothetical protein
MSMPQYPEKILGQIECRYLRSDAADQTHNDFWGGLRRPTNSTGDGFLLNFILKYSIAMY